MGRKRDGVGKGMDRDGERGRKLEKGSEQGAEGDEI